MKLIKAGSAIALAALALGTSAQAQTCLGAASFRGQPVSLGVGLSARDNFGSAHAEMGAGSSTGVFGLARAGVTGKSDHTDIFNFDDNTNKNNDTKSSYAGIRLGFDVPVDAAKRTSICPMVAYNHVFGPTITTTGTGASSTKSTTDSFSGGVGIGGAVLTGRNVNLVPSLAFEVVSDRTSSTRTVGSALGVKSPDVTQTYTSVTVGLGIVVHRRFTIFPFAAFPVGLEEGVGTGGIMIRANLGGN